MELFKNNQQLITYLKNRIPQGNNWNEKNYVKQEIVIGEYKKAETIYFLLEGTATVEILSDDKQYISAFIFENDLFGIDSFSTFKQKSHTIRIISPTATIFSIKKTALLAALNHDPHYYELILTNFADIFQRHYGYFDFLHLSPTNRVHYTLNYLSDYIGIINLHNELELPKFITQDILAKFCRTSQSRISLSLKELYQTGWLLKKTIPLTINQTNC
ncbi:Crp/Fnr family transcriptional regulator [Carnobacterium gallinarum]|uniref:Crp/Fnr family transcriptional regulator n=1 Tax=Carnobacterium gallinarum TaxID=2749 RepID=UPI000556C619|nr:Crp/Fnr family transcriptional regulator [Carnobacterium gallinarum]